MFVQTLAQLHKVGNTCAKVKQC